jgi:1-acyl-sn-glycerol-3-phosphate acyltransferase
MGAFLRWSQQVDTEDFLTNGAQALADGFSVVVFPEGSRSATGQVGRFRRGAFELAVRTGVPVLPVSLDGSQYILSKRDFFPTRFLVTVVAHVLPPIEPGSDAKMLGRRCRSVVTEELRRIRRNA